MFSPCNITDSCSTSTDFSMREITGRWVSRDGHTKVYIYPNIIQKWGGTRLRLTYNNPLVVCDRALKRWFNITSTCTGTSGLLTIGSKRSCTFPLSESMSGRRISSFGATSGFGR